MRIKKSQTVCEWMNTNPDKPEADSIVGLAIDSLNNGIIHGLRHPKKGNSNGWFIWAGEYSEDKNFFKPICYNHLAQYFDKNIIEFLSLPVGYRFLVDGSNYEDVWFDEKLLIID